MIKEWKQLKCSICGGELEEKNNKLVCKYCRAVYECVERISEDEVIQLNQATVQRNLLLFDDAGERYELILKKYPNNSEAAWGAFLCSYGIIYEEDYDGTYKPTCHRLNECPVEKSPYYSKLSDSAKVRAREIEILRQSILAQAKSIPPYDVFICYKATDDWHGRSMPTRESNWARDIYEMLTRDMGLKVFFAEKCLSGSNTDYEPHIYSALQSAKLMLVLANSLEHVNAVWVQNEWRRYAKYIREGKSKTIRVIFDQVEPYSLPRELQAKQAICHDSMGWDKQLQASIEEIFKKEEPKKDARDEELEFLRKQIEELKKAQAAQATRQTTQATAPATPAPTVTRQAPPSVSQTATTSSTSTIQTQSPTPSTTSQTSSEFEIQNGVLVKYKGNGGEVIIPNTVTKIAEKAFEQIRSSMNVVLPNSVVSIDSMAFFFCLGLKSIEIPKSVISIKGFAFAFSSGTTFYVEASEKPTGWDEQWNADKCPVVWGYKKQTATTATTAPQSTLPTKPNPPSAAQANEGIANSLFNKGWEFHQKKDYVRAAQFYLQACEYNHKVAQNNLGVCYANGYGVPLDRAKAVEYYSKAANQGYSIAQNNLGSCYEKGLGVTQDRAKAVEYYLKSANQGYAKAQHNLGCCYEKGNGVPQSYQKALEYYQQAAAQNYQDSIFNIGVLYDQGKGVAQNKAVARSYFERGANLGHMLSQFNLGCSYYFDTPPNYEKAVFWFTKSADQGYANAEYNLSNCYFYGYGVAKDQQKAAEFAQKAADKGSADAQNRIGYQYLHGVGVNKNYSLALKYLNMASAKNMYSQYNLGYCYENGLGVQKNLRTALTWYQKGAANGHSASAQKVTELKQRLGG